MPNIKSIVAVLAALAPEAQAKVNTAANAARAASAAINAIEPPKVRKRRTPKVVAKAALAPKVKAAPKTKKVLRPEDLE